MYLKKFRLIDGYLALAALLPFDEKLPPIEEAPSGLVEDVARRWVEAAAAKPELGLPVLPRVGGAAEDRYELFQRVRTILSAIIDVVSDPKVKLPEGNYRSVLDSRITDLSLP